MTKLHQPYKYKDPILKHKPINLQEIELGFEVFKREAEKNAAKIISTQKLPKHEGILKGKPKYRINPRDLVLHSYERIAIIAEGAVEPERTRILRAARSKGYLTRMQFKALMGGAKVKIRNRTKSNRKRKPMRYGTYIKSKIWFGRRNLYWQTHPRRCVICNTAQRIHLHHMVYHGYNGTEPDNHLVGLCEDHHNLYHKLNGTQGNMLKTTQAFIDEQIQLAEMVKITEHL